MIDALLSLPILSFLALPALSSYGTSLNLLFFYMTWSTLVLSHSELAVELYGALFVRLLCAVLPGLLFLAFDAAVPSLAKEVKAHGNLALPAAAARKGGRTSVARVVGCSLCNLLLGLAVQAAVEVLFTQVLQIRSALKVTTRLPMPWALFTDVVKAFVIRNTLIYYIHRYVLHSPERNARLTRWHMSWQHSIRAPYSFVANYDHPVCWLLLRFVPLYLPAVVFRFHILTYLLGLALSSLEETLTYSGYSVLPSTIIMTGMARRQDGHLISGGKGNFGPWGVLDWLHGTTIGADVMDDLKEEMEKHDVEEKKNAAVEGASDWMKKKSERMSKGKEQGSGKSRS